MCVPLQKIDQQIVGAELFTLLKSVGSRWQRERRLAIKLIMEGANTQKVADGVGRSQDMIHD